MSIDLKMECHFCLVNPCILATALNQYWLENPKTPHQTNRRIRKKMYWRFWGLLSNAAAFLDARYILRKIQALQQHVGPVKLGWEILPTCVVQVIKN